MNKILKYTVMIFTATFFMMSCEKNGTQFDTTPVGDMALVQIHNQIPIPTGTEGNFFKVEINEVDISRNGGDPPVNYPLNTWSSLPSTGRYYQTTTGEANFKLYQGQDRVLKYDKNATLKSGKNSLVFYDFNQPPITFMEPDFYPVERDPYYSDTITYVRFFHLMREKQGVSSNLKLQYQYQYVYNPVYTEDDENAGKIPAGSKVGDAVPTANRVRSPWINLGGPLSFGEDTGWQVVPCKREGWLTGNVNAARVEYRIVVAQGGVVGETMTAGDNLLICRTSRTAAAVTTTGFVDYRTGYVGRREFHFFSGYRDDIPGMAVAYYYQQ